MCVWLCSTVSRNSGARARCPWVPWHSCVWGWGNLVCLPTCATKPFVRNADGSIDVWVQSTPPVGEKATNWLPSPANGERFWFIARSYGPKPEVLEGKFSLPHVEVIQ
ncbi:DUF1214 domain-containing protein [Comamonas thiooxydans]|uniref:DUF1214 domain-containing protein n=1 Tax=Comamonas thiooxydans TaxID=363952 RepID=UPI003CFC6BE3